MKKVIQEKLPLETKNEEKYFVAMSNIAVQSGFFKAKLFEYFDYDIKRAFDCNKEDLASMHDFYGNVSVPSSFLKERDGVDLDKVYEENMQDGIKILTYNDEKYPALLKNIPDFPLMLYYKGDLDGLNFNRTVAFVGSRRATNSAKEVVAKVISEFQGLDILIVSGLAEGIDAAAHKSALEYGLKTVGVIGSGFNFQYPSSNKKLYEEIESGGGVVMSEYPYYMSPLPHLFPLRNRIVTGMSSGTVVGEARLKSGAMISARLALEFGRELMCIPGIVSNPNTEGIYKLLKEGASMVTSGEDVLEALNWDVEIQEKEELDLSPVEKKIYDEIALEARNLEDLCAVCEIEMGDLMVNLTSMELKGLIKKTGGNYFIKG